MALNPNQGIMVVEGNHTMLSPQLICVVLSVNGNAGLDRDVLVNVITSEESATGGYMYNTPYIHINSMHDV